jgi:hypothetical protein
MRQVLLGVATRQGLNKLALYFGMDVQVHHLFIVFVLLVTHGLINAMYRSFPVEFFLRPHQIFCQMKLKHFVIRFFALLYGEDLPYKRE